MKFYSILFISSLLMTGCEQASTGGDPETNESVGNTFSAKGKSVDIYTTAKDYEIRLS